MLQRTARHPAALTAIAAAIVLAAATVAAPVIAPPVHQAYGQVEKVTVSAPLRINAPKTYSNASDSNASSGNASSSAASLAAPQIAKTADVSLYVSDVEAVAARIGALARREGGDTFSLDVSAQTGTVEVRVPAGNFDATMNALARYGTVAERSTSAEDLSANITDSSAKLRNLRRTESDILHIMDRSGTVEQVLNAENQLSDVRGQIEQLEADLKSMRQRVVYSTIKAELDAEPVTVPPRPGVGARLRNQWNDALAHVGEFSLSIVAFLMWLVVFSPYVLVPALAVWLLARLARRKHAIRG